MALCELLYFAMSFGYASFKRWSLHLCPRAKRWVSHKVWSSHPPNPTSCHKGRDVHAGWTIWCWMRAQPGRVLAVLDWELSTLGDPLADLAYLCLPYHMPLVWSAVSAQNDLLCTTPDATLAADPTPPQIDAGPNRHAGTGT